jgi:signal transduction histidine kinase
LPDVRLVEIQPQEGGSPISVGNQITKSGITRLFPMLHQHRDREVDVGTLKIVVSLEGVYARLREKFLVILGTQAIRTFATSLFILFIVQALITRHLNTLGSHAERLNLNELDTSLSLNRSPNRKPDELDHVVTAMEKMRNRLISDLAFLHTAEEERKRLIADLEAKNSEMESFAHTVSHDLKSPLITIQGFLSLLRKDLAKGDLERVEKDLTRISSATSKMYQLLEDLLALSRAGRLIGEPDEVNLYELVHETLELLTGRIEAASIQIDVSSDLPVVLGDRSRLQAVFQNLIENSAKFMGHQENPRIKIGVRTQPGETVIYIADNGIGIDQAQQKKVFGLFNKLDNKAAGTGIGLALVHRIIEVHRGRIWIESKGSGKGCTLCFTLPAAEFP